MRSKAWRRHKNLVKALRKARIIKEQNDYWNYKSLNQLVKGKIHCSCPMCSSKTKKDGYSHSDLKKITKCKSFVGGEN